MGEGDVGKRTNEAWDADTLVTQSIEEVELGQRWGMAPTRRPRVTTRRAAVDPKRRHLFGRAGTNPTVQTESILPGPCGTKSLRRGVWSDDRGRYACYKGLQGSCG